MKVVTFEIATTLVQLASPSSSLSTRGTAESRTSAEIDACSPHWHVE